MQVRNAITLIGNLGADPKKTVTDGGLVITEFRLATNDYYRDRDGNRQTRTDWHTVKAFGKLAEVFAEHLRQGSQLCVAGTLRYNKWVDKFDQVRNTAEIIAHDFTFLGGNGRSAHNDSATTPDTGVVAEPVPGSTAASPKANAQAKANASAPARKTVARKPASGKTRAKPAPVADVTPVDDLPF